MTGPTQSLGGAPPAPAAAEQPEPVPFAMGAPVQRSVDAEQRFAWRWVGVAAVLVSVFIGYQLLLILQGWVGALLDVVLYLVFGAVLAFVGAPVVSLLHGRLRVPRTAAVLAALLLEVLTVAAILYVVAGPLAAEARGLASQVPSLLDRGRHLLDDLQARLGRNGVNLGGGSFSGGLSGGNLAARVGDLLLATVTSGITVVADIAITLVTAFWLLRDGERLRGALDSALPGRLRAPVDFAFDATAAVIGGYVRGQLLMAALVGGMAWLGCTAIGVPYPIVVGVAAGVFELVPMVGPFVGGAVGALLALTVSPTLMLWTVAVFVGIHIVEGYIVAPRIQAKFVQLHPLVAFLALVAGIEVDGILGALFAVPAASLAAVLLRAYMGDWRVQHPEHFLAATAQDPVEERRRRLLLGFRLFEVSPLLRARAWAAAGWRSGRLRRLLPLVLGVAAVVALVLSVQPARLGGALSRYDPVYAPPMVALSLGYFVLQGLRWHVLLDVRRIRLRRRDTVLLDVAGQSTAMLPLGELTRAVFVSEVTGAGLGAVTATVTVQELVYAAFLIAVAIPGALGFPVAAGAVVAALLGTVAVIVILTVEPVFDAVHRAVGHVPGLRRLSSAVLELHRSTVELLADRRTYTTAWVSMLQAAMAITLFWLSAHSIGADVGWTTIAFVYAALHIASAMSMSPGGMGAFELGGAGLLMAMGLPYNMAAATAVVHRLADKGVGTAAGAACYAVARRRWHLGAVRLMGLRQGRGDAGAPAAQAQDEGAPATCPPQEREAEETGARPGG